jgi:hypothetical protein
MVMEQVHRIVDVGEILDRIHHLAAEVGVVDQRLVLRAVKSWGRLLDSEGHTVDLVPVDPWAPVDR